jgi:hypothetical protein
MTEMTINTGARGVAWRADLCDRGGERSPKLRQCTDDRYRRLLGEGAWGRLPIAIRRRFSKGGGTARTTVYRGHLERTDLSAAGWLVAQVLRVIGAPLPLEHGAFRPGDRPATVVVEEMLGANGQVWSRLYSRGERFPQVVSSAKRFTGETGLEEHLGLGVVMRLTLREEAGALVFRSAGYHVGIGSVRIELPALLSPGRCEIGHRVAPADRHGVDAFTFALTLTHPLFGRLVHQVAWFTDDPAVTARPMTSPEELCHVAS